MKGPEAELDEDGGSNGNGGPESRHAFEKGAEGECDENELDTGVGRDTGEACPEDVKMSAINRELVEKKNVQDDPANRK